jgi:hypothetical protein
MCVLPNSIACTTVCSRTPSILGRKILQDARCLHLQDHEKVMTILAGEMRASKSTMVKVGELMSNCLRWEEKTVLRP